MVVAIEIVAFRRVAARTPELWRHLALLSLENNARSISLVQDLMLRGSRERLAAFSARQGGLRDAHPPALPVVDATQSDIAEMANLSRSIVSALLLKMERDGFVRQRRACVEIVDAARLLQMLKAGSDARRP